MPGKYMMRLQKKNDRRAGPRNEQGIHQAERQKLAMPISQSGSVNEAARLLRQVQLAPDSISPAEASLLQRSLGNQNMRQLTAVPAAATILPSADHVRRSLVNLMEQRTSIRRKPNSDPRPASTGGLTLGAVGDRHEQEADQAAAQIVGVPAHQATIRRQDVVGANGGPIAPKLEHSIQTARRGGQPLPRDVRQSMESSFGADFSGVKVHSDARSDLLNRSLQARAFTAGQDVFFRHGEYNPGSSQGQELLAHELTHVVQQNGDSVRRKAPVKRSGDQPASASDVKMQHQSPSDEAIQRKIGFEFEADLWYSWKQTQPLSPEEATQSPQERRIPIEKYVPLKKKDVIYSGQGFNIEADESKAKDGMDRTQSDIEFVTDAFEESSAGVRQMKSSLDAIASIAERIVGLRAGGVKVGNFNWSDELNAIGIPTADLMFSFGDRPMKVKMQATAGLRLDQIAKFMASVGSAQPGETARESRRRRRGRDLFTQVTNLGAKVESTSMKKFGSAPADAEQAITHFVWKHSRPGVPALYRPEVSKSLQDRESLKGLLSLMISYLQLGNELKASYPKAIAPLMARTDFGKLFQMLPQEQKILFRGDEDLWLELVEDAVGLPLDAPIFTKQPEWFPDLTRGLWIEQLLRSFDLLTQIGYQALAQAQLPDGPTHEEAQEYGERMIASEELESLGSYGSKTDRLPSGAEAAIVELRNIPNYMEYTEIKKIAVNLAKYIADLNKGKDKNYGE